MIIDTDKIQPAYPTGRCYCGCGTAIDSDKFFVTHHDQPARTKLERVAYGNLATHLLAHGYGPDNPLPTYLDKNGVPLRKGDRIAGTIRGAAVPDARVTAESRTGGYIVLWDEGQNRERSGKPENFEHI